MGEDLENSIIGGHISKHGRRDRKYDSLGGELGLGQDVVNQEAMNPSVAIDEWVNKDEPKRRSRSRANRINRTLGVQQTHRHFHPAAHY